jgi:membrane protease YdiL (CAAX protease family)
VTPAAPRPRALDDAVAQLAAELAERPERRWGVPDALLAVLSVPAVLLVTVLLLAALPGLDASSATQLQVLGTVVATALLGMAAALVARRPAARSGGAQRALGLELPAWSDAGTVLGWSLLLLLAQGAALVAVAAAVPALRGVPADNASFLRAAEPAALVVLAVAAVLVAPVLEELLFRGVILRGLMLRTGFWPAAVVSSVVFGLFHATGTALDAVPIVVATGVFGLGLCLLTRGTAALGPAIGVHALRNALAVAAVALG